MSLSKRQQEELLRLQAQEEEYWAHNKRDIFYRDIDYVAPDGTKVWGKKHYRKFDEFYAAGKDFKERAVVAANRVGKTFRVLSEIIFHATLEYPSDWSGKRYSRPLRILVGCDRGSTAKDVIQTILLGPTADINDSTGLLKTSEITGHSPLPGIPGCHGDYQIKSKKGVSTISIRTYNSGRNAFEGAKYDIIAVDEEAPRDILSEIFLRTMGIKDSMILASFTPDSGISDTYLHFCDKKNTDIYSVNITWDDVPHLSEIEKTAMLKALTPQERECRSKGIPYLGKGKIYQYTEDSFLIEPIEIPSYWPRAYGMDVGYSHPTAVVWGALDRDSDTLYLYSEYKISEAPPSSHANAVLGRGRWIPGVIDTSSNARGSGSQEDGSRLSDLYLKFGLDIEPVMKGHGSAEAGIFELCDRFESGRIKVFRTLTEWLAEYRLYRRDDRSQIVRVNNDLMDATRYLNHSGLERSIVEPRYGRQSTDYDRSSTRDPYTGY
jgi:phage terminase large subunit-like protein